MAETSDDPGPGAHEEAGSVGEEAAKLFSVLSGWARDTGLVSADTAADAGQGMVANHREARLPHRNAIAIGVVLGIENRNPALDDLRRRKRNHDGDGDRDQPREPQVLEQQQHADADGRANPGAARQREQQADNEGGHDKRGP